jgi:hypothetical protein
VEPTPTTRIDLPAYVREPYEVFVNGVPQAAGTDYEVVGPSLIFNKRLVSEGKLGPWRWLSMLLGIAGTYRQNDKIDVVFSVDGRPKVVTLIPAPAPAEPAPPLSGGSV